MNKLQRTIIRRLLASPALRYAQIKPKLTEGNLFSYHLRKLIQDGLVAKDKESGQYSLTSNGKLFVDRLSMETLTPRIQPKIVNMLIIKNKKHEYLVYKRKRIPFIGKIGFPHGKIHLGESVFAAAHRELKEKIGFETKLTYRGDVYAAVYQKGELVTHILSHIFTGIANFEKSKGKDKTADCYWAKIDQPHDECYLPAFGDIYDLVKKSNKNFFAEFVYNL